MLSTDLMQVRQTQGKVINHPYKNGTFTGTLRNNKPFDGDVLKVDIGYKTFDGVIKEGALAYPNRTRLQRSGSVTPFQRILRDASSLQSEAGWTGSKHYEQLRRKVLNYDLSYVKLDTDEKFDVTNDTQRRFFDTVFAKELLVRTLGHPDSKLRQYSNNTFAFFRKTLLPEQFDAWNSACEGHYVGTDQRLQQLSTQALRAGEAIHSLPLSSEQKHLCLDLYQRRYLNYLVDETDIYKNDHPKGIIKSKTNPLYFKRGRLDGDFAIRDSVHTGIMRNIDPCPTDLRFLQIPKKSPNIDPALYTRCPDRLHMAAPDDVLDRDPDSWLSRNFLSGNTPFVNGLSGSMLIEIGSLAYIKEQLSKGSGNEDFLASSDMIPVADDYFRAMAALYVFVDGGHSLFEIQSAFKQTWVAPSLVKVFEDPRWATVGQDLYRDKDAFATAWQATRQFDQVLQTKQRVHQELRTERRPAFVSSLTQDKFHEKDTVID